MRNRRVIKKCAKCNNDRLPGTGQKFCADHKLTRNGDSQSGLAQRAWRYNISVDQLERMEIDRGGRCDICGKPNSDGRALSVDHDHSCCAGNTSCGECVRGLLCNRCNRAIGMFEDDYALLESAASYLKNSSYSPVGETD